MKYYPIFALTVMILPGSGANPKEPENISSQNQVFSGRLEFLGEFNLYAFPRSSARARECISGAFELDKHRAVRRKFSGQEVRIIGKKVLYSSLVEYVGPTELGWKGTPIPNYCGGEYVILASRVQKIHRATR